MLDFLAKTDAMKFVVRSGDLGDGHLVEAGLDFWSVYDASVSAPPVADILVEDSLCGPGMVQFEDASSQFPYSWYWEFPGGSPAFSTEQNPEISYAASGSYDVTLSVYNGQGTSVQTFTAAVVVPDEMELTGSGISSTTGSNGSASVNITGGVAPYSIQWDDPAVQTTETAIGLGGGVYTATVTDANGCMQTVTVIVDGIPNGISTIDGINITMGANPFTAQTSISWESSVGAAINYTAYDALGRLVETGTLNGASGVLNLGSTWPAGMITINFTIDDNSAGAVQVIKF